MAFLLGGFMKGVSQGFKDSQEWEKAATSWRNYRSRARSSEYLKNLQNAFGADGMTKEEASKIATEAEEGLAKLAQGFGGGGFDNEADTAVAGASTWASRGEDDDLGFAMGGPVIPSYADGGAVQRNPKHVERGIPPSDDYAGQRMTGPMPTHPSLEEGAVPPPSPEPAPRAAGEGAGGSGGGWSTQEPAKGLGRLLLKGIADFFKAEPDEYHHAPSKSTGGKEQPFEGAPSHPTQADFAKAIPPVDRTDGEGGGKGSFSASGGSGRGAGKKAIKTEDEMDFDKDQPNEVPSYGERWARGELSEGEAVLERGIRAFSADDWHRTTVELMSEALLRGEDPAKALQYVHDLQSMGLHKNIQASIAAYKAGDLVTAGRAAEKAYNTYMPDGSFMRIQPIGEGPNAKLLGMVYDEKTGKRESQQPVVITPDVLAEIDRRFTSTPEAWNEFTHIWAKDRQTMEHKEEDQAIALDKAGKEHPYLARKAAAETTQEEIKAEHGEAAALAEIEAKRASAEKDREYVRTGGADSAEKLNQYRDDVRQAVDSAIEDVERQIENNMGQLDDDGNLIEGGPEHSAIKNATGIRNTAMDIAHTNFRSGRSIPPGEVANFAIAWHHAAATGQYEQFFGSRDAAARQFGYDEETGRGAIGNPETGEVYMYLPGNIAQKIHTWLKSPDKKA